MSIYRWQRFAVTIAALQVSKLTFSSMAGMR
jgi:hypothetical protein